MNSRDFLLKAIGSPKAAPSIPRVILIAPDEQGTMQVTEGGRIVPDGSIDPDQWVICVTETNADKVATNAALKKAMSKTRILPDPYCLQWASIDPIFGGGGD